MKTHDQYIIFDGELLPASEPVIPVLSRGLMYGDGIFETFRTYRGQTFLLDEHIARLTSGLQLLHLSPKQEITATEIRKLVFRLLEKQKLLDSDAIVRMQIWRGGERGYHPKKNAETHFAISASACPDDFSTPTLVTVSTKRIPSQSLPAQVKHTNGINYILAAREASKKEADDALMQTVDGWVSETTIANIFWCKGQTIFTPDTDCDLLPGITRNLLVEIINNLENWKLNEGKYVVSDVEDTQTVWMCNSVREILPVKQIDDHKFDTHHPVIKILKEEFNKYLKENIKPLHIDG